MRHSIFFISIVVTLVLTSCSGYNNVMKSDDYARKFEMANQLYDDGQELRSVGLYEQVYQRMPKTGEGEVSYFRIGKAYYLGGDYYMAGYYLGQFAQRFSTSTKAEEALFLSAMCGVQGSPEWSLDQDETELAINDLQQFVDRYPNSSLLDSCNNIIDKLRFKLEKKEYESVKLYSKTEQFGAAVSSSITFMDDFPASSFKEEVFYILVKNSSLLSKNSVQSKKRERIDQAMERYRTFVAEFPESKYISSLAGYMSTLEKAKEDLKETNI